MKQTTRMNRRVIAVAPTKPCLERLGEELRAEAERMMVVEPAKVILKGWRVERPCRTAILNALRVLVRRPTRWPLVYEFVVAEG